MPKHCPTCNKSSDEISFYGEFCYDCASKKLLEGLVSAVEIGKCKRCERIKVTGNDYENLNKTSLEEVIARKFQKYGVHLLEFDHENATVEIAEDTEKGVLIAEKKIHLDFKKILCDKCYKKASNYHEAVVQLRGNADSIERMIGRITRYVERNGDFISKVEQADGGANVYVSNKRTTAAFIMQAKLHPVTSYTLMGIKNGKRVYKNTYALHF